jgi:hypothetical protein
MRTSVVQDNDASLSLTLGIPSGEELADARLTGRATPSDPVRGCDAQACACAGDRSHRRYDRETMVNRLLDWSEAARALGRVQRAEYLVCLAWEAYDRVPCR